MSNLIETLAAQLDAYWMRADEPLLAPDDAAPTARPCPAAGAALLVLIGAGVLAALGMSGGV